MSSQSVQTDTNDPPVGTEQTLATASNPASTPKEQAPMPIQPAVPQQQGANNPSQPPTYYKNVSDAQSPPPSKAPQLEWSKYPVQVANHSGGPYQHPVMNQQHQNWNQNDQRRGPMVQQQQQQQWHHQQHAAPYGYQQEMNSNWNQMYSPMQQQRKCNPHHGNIYQQQQVQVPQPMNQFVQKARRHSNKMSTYMQQAQHQQNAQMIQPPHPQYGHHYGHQPAYYPNQLGTMQAPHQHGAAMNQQPLTQYGNQNADQGYYQHNVPVPQHEYSDASTYQHQPLYQNQQHHYQPVASNVSSQAYNRNYGGNEVFHKQQVPLLVPQQIETAGHGKNERSDFESKYSPGSSSLPMEKLPEASERPVNSNEIESQNQPKATNSVGTQVQAEDDKDETETVAEALCSQNVNTDKQQLENMLVDSRLEKPDALKSEDAERKMDSQGTSQALPEFPTPSTTPSLPGSAETSPSLRPHSRDPIQKIVRFIGKNPDVAQLMPMFGVPVPVAVHVQVPIPVPVHFVHHVQSNMVMTPQVVDGPARQNEETNHLANASTNKQSDQGSAIAVSEPKEKNNGVVVSQDETDQEVIVPTTAKLTCTGKLVTIPQNGKTGVELDKVAVNGKNGSTESNSENVLSVGAKLYSDIAKQKPKLKNSSTPEVCSQEAYLPVSSGQEQKTPAASQKLSNQKKDTRSAKYASPKVPGGTCVKKTATNTNGARRSNDLSSYGPRQSNTSTNKTCQQKAQSQKNVGPGKVLEIVSKVYSPTVPLPKPTRLIKLSRSVELPFLKLKTKPSCEAQELSPTPEMPSLKFDIVVNNEEEKKLTGEKKSDGRKASANQDEEAKKSGLLPVPDDVQNMVEPATAKKVQKKTMKGKKKKNKGQKASAKEEEDLDALIEQFKKEDQKICAASQNETDSSSILGSSARQELPPRSVTTVQKPKRTLTHLEMILLVTTAKQAEIYVDYMAETRLRLLQLSSCSEPNAFKDDPTNISSEIYEYWAERPLERCWSHTSKEEIASFLHSRIEKYEKSENVTEKKLAFLYNAYNSMTSTIVFQDVLWLSRKCLNEEDRAKLDRNYYQMVTFCFEKQNLGSTPDPESTSSFLNVMNKENKAHFDYFVDYVFRMQRVRAGNVEEIRSDAEKLLLETIEAQDQEEVVLWTPNDTKMFIEELIQKLPSVPSEKKERYVMYCGILADIRSYVIDSDVYHFKHYIYPQYMSSPHEYLFNLWFDD